MNNDDAIERISEIINQDKTIKKFGYDIFPFDEQICLHFDPPMKTDAGKIVISRKMLKAIQDQTNCTIDVIEIISPEDGIEPRHPAVEIMLNNPDGEAETYCVIEDPEENIEKEKKALRNGSTV